MFITYFQILSKREIMMVAINFKKNATNIIQNFSKVMVLKLYQLSVSVQYLYEV